MLGMEDRSYPNLKKNKKKSDSEPNLRSGDRTGILGFEPLPLEFLLVLALIVGLYLFCAENVKRVFYQYNQ